MNKNKQCEETMNWIGALADACEEVIMTTDVSLIEPFELVNLINVRLHMEQLKTNKIKKSESNTKPNLVFLPSVKKDKNDDTH